MRCDSYFGFWINGEKWMIGDLMWLKWCFDGKCCGMMCV